MQRPELLQICLFSNFGPCWCRIPWLALYLATLTENTGGIAHFGLFRNVDYYLSNIAQRIFYDRA